MRILMKLLKSILTASLVSAFIWGNAQANTPKNNQKQSTKQTQAKQTKKQAAKPKQQAKTAQKKATTAKKAAAATAAAAAAPAVLSQDEALKLFNQSFGIRLLGYKVDNNTEGKPHLYLKYELTNKGQKDVQGVKFIGAFTHNSQIIYAQEVPLTFNNPLKAQDKTVIDMAIPFENVPEIARPLMLDQNAQLGVVTGAQTLVFTDNTGIQIY